MSEESSSDGRLANGRFGRGNPGGPGRPRAVERITALDQRAAEAAPELIDALVVAAKGGNVKAIEMLLNRVWPMRRGHPVQLDVPEIRGMADLLPAGAALTQAVLTGHITPEEGRATARVLAAHQITIDKVETERRMTEIDDKLNAIQAARRARS